jgi:hypothetical protein
VVGEIAQDDWASWSQKATNVCPRAALSVFTGYCLSYDTNASKKSNQPPNLRRAVLGEHQDHSLDVKPINLDLLLLLSRAIFCCFCATRIIPCGSRQAALAVMHITDRFALWNNRSKKEFFSAYRKTVVETPEKFFSTRAPVGKVLNCNIKAIIRGCGKCQTLTKASRATPKHQL